MSSGFGHPCAGAELQRSRNGGIARFCGFVSTNTGQKSRPLALQGGLGVCTIQFGVSKWKFRLDWNFHFEAAHLHDLWCLTVS